MYWLRVIIERLQKPIVKTQGSRAVPRYSPENAERLKLLHQRQTWLKQRQKERLLEKLRQRMQETLRRK
jgi:hypothetical protein